MSMVAVSPRAWEIIDEIDYAGYDALKPFKTAAEDAYFPYTPYWHGLAALHIGTQLLVDEGLENSYARHAAAAEHCRAGIQALGIELYPTLRAFPSPTVTAVKVPDRTSWSELDRRCRARGLALGGNYGLLAGKVFRIGHMGSQANLALVDQALEVLVEVYKEI